MSTAGALTEDQRLDIMNAQLRMQGMWVSAEPGLLTGGVFAEQVQLQEVAVCFGGQLMRGNRAQKVNASNYQAFDSPTYHKLALLGVEVDWQARYLLQVSFPFQRLESLHRPACCSFVIHVLTVFE